jgi:hypothetical protein
MTPRRTPPLSLSWSAARAIASPRSSRASLRLRRCCLDEAGRWKDPQPRVTALPICDRPLDAMETAARCEGPSFWPADERRQPVSNGGNTSSGSSSSSDASADSPLLAPPAAGPAPSAAQLQELSAFLAASGDHPPGHGALSSTLLDELLGTNDDLDQLPGARTAGGLTTDGLGEGVAGLLDIGARQTAALLHGPSASALAAQSPPHATARLLQLEDNYERKKKRAKINRKDLNARFQDLMELLHLREDRKLNRAKVLEKAIEHIESLTAELKAIKAQLGGGVSSHAARNAQISSHASAHKAAAMVPIALPARRSSSGIQHHAIAPLNCSSTTTMMPIAAGAHPWGAGTGSTMPLASMVWVPCPVVGHPMSASLAVDTSGGRSAARGGNSSTNSKRRRLKRSREVESESDSSVDERHHAQVGQRDGGGSASWDAEVALASAGAAAVWAVLEIPTVLQFCDAWSLTSVMQTCKELERAARRESLWASLVQRRWRVPSSWPQLLPARQQWTTWHTSNRMPECSSITVRLYFVM